LTCVTEAPQTLQELSRLVIRRSVRGQNLVRHVHDGSLRVRGLPLPESLKQYLLFARERPADVDDAADDVSDKASFDEDNSTDEAESDGDDGGWRSCIFSPAHT
jgi:hypothetical protein